MSLYINVLLNFFFSFFIAVKVASNFEAQNTQKNEYEEVACSCIVFSHNFEIVCVDLRKDLKIFFAYIYFVNLGPHVKSS